MRTVLILWLFCYASLALFSQNHLSNTSVQIKSVRVHLIADRSSDVLDSILIKVTVQGDSNIIAQAYTDTAGNTVFNLPDTGRFNITGDKKCYAFNTLHIRTDTVVSPLNMWMLRIMDCGISSINIRNTMFRFKSTAIDTSEYSNLDMLARVLTENPTMVIEIAGNSDCMEGQSKATMATERANSVAKYFILKGAGKDQLLTTGYSDKHNLNACNCDRNNIKQNCQETDHAINRRVEFKAIKF